MLISSVSAIHGILNQTFGESMNIIKLIIAITLLSSVNAFASCVGDFKEGQKYLYEAEIRRNEAFGRARQINEGTPISNDVKYCKDALKARALLFKVTKNYKNGNLIAKDLSKTCTHKKYRDFSIEIEANTRPYVNAGLSQLAALDEVMQTHCGATDSLSSELI